jgi:signal transduction histidine kinase
VPTLSCGLDVTQSQARAARDSPDQRPEPVLFPQIARLELDELLVQLVQRAQEVQSTQGRLRGLLAATQAISGHLPLPALLLQITEAARDLVGARYAALGVLGTQDELSDFITVGVDEQTTRRIGRLPHGEGVLGLLIDDPRPLRLPDLATHPMSAGVPAGHPPMHSFLGVPVRVRDEVFGNLYLTEKQSGASFTVEDEELLRALASAAGVAIDNARLVQTAQRRQRTLEAAAEVSREVLAGKTDVLPLVLARVRQVVAASRAVLLLPVPHAVESMLVRAADGTGAAGLVGQLVPRKGSVGDLALREERTVVLDDGSAGEGGRPPGAAVGAALALCVPSAGGSPLAVLLLSREPGRPGFTRDEQDTARVFADQAGVALELAHQQDQRRWLLLLEDRERIARDLHDQVIQRLFGEGMAVAALIARVGDPAIALRLEQHVERLDETISAIRQTIFELQQRPGDPQRFRVLLLGAVRDVTPALGRPPVVRVVGPVDTLVSEEVTGHAVAVVREALMNVARHAHATHVQLSVDVDQHRLSVVVTDDGVGLDGSGRLSGRANLLRRAEQLAGRFSVCSPDPATGTGTRLEWIVPTSQPVRDEGASREQQVHTVGGDPDGRDAVTALMDPAAAGDEDADLDLFPLDTVEAQERGVHVDELPDGPPRS